jgi:hypothetical protein
LPERIGAERAALVSADPVKRAFAAAFAASRRAFSALASSASFGRTAGSARPDGEMGTGLRATPSTNEIANALPLAPALYWALPSGA